MGTGALCGLASRHYNITAFKRKFVSSEFDVRYDR